MSFFCPSILPREEDFKSFMATRKSSKGPLAKKWQENYASFILGAIIVVILGLLVANFITNRNGGTVDTQEADQMTAEEEARQAGASKEYKVVQDDSLSKIAEREYGDKMMWPVLARANNIANPNIINVDATLKIPSKDDAGQIQKDMTATSYQVQKDDTLFIIAQKMYGDGSRWTVLDRANKVGRLSNGNPLIFEGSTLSIPR